MNGLDRRLNAYRDDLADSRLEGRVAAVRFSRGHEARVAAPVADLRAAPRPDAATDTQLLRGDLVKVFEEVEGWCWVQAAYDGYVGYCAAAALSPQAPPSTHRVSVPRTFLYAGPDLKMPVIEALPMGAAVAIEGEAETRGTRYALLPGGTALVAAHLMPVGEAEPDYVSVAERLVGVPYLWGGTSGAGVDCSGLVQLAMRLAGRDAPRDTDMQAASLGTIVEPGRDGSGLCRGDLVFWTGHVAIVTAPGEIVHASGAAMLVVREPLAAAIERIARLYGPPTICRRPADQ